MKEVLQTTTTTRGSLIRPVMVMPDGRGSEVDEIHVEPASFPLDEFYNLPGVRLSFVDQEDRASRVDLRYDDAARLGLSLFGQVQNGGLVGWVLEKVSAGVHLELRFKEGNFRVLLFPEDAAGIGAQLREEAAQP